MTRVDLLPTWHTRDDGKTYCIRRMSYSMVCDLYDDWIRHHGFVPDDLADLLSKRRAEYLASRIESDTKLPENY